MLMKRYRELSLARCCCHSGMLLKPQDRSIWEPIGIFFQFFIRRHARRIEASRKCERIGRGYAKELLGLGSPGIERCRSEVLDTDRVRLLIDCGDRWMAPRLMRCWKSRCRLA